MIFAKSRADLVAATKALDRVLLWNHYVVPQWSYGKQRTARWDRFSHADPLPQYGNSGFPKHLVVGCAEGGEDGRPVVKATRLCPATTAKSGERMCARAPKIEGRTATAAAQ